MRKTFTPLDDVLIEWVFQPVSDVLSYQAGVGRGGAACFCLDLASLAWIVSCTSALSGAVTDWDAGAAFLDTMLLLFGLTALISLRTLFRRTWARSRNPLRPAMQPHRAIVLLMLVGRLVERQAPDLSAAADVAMLMFAAAALYLGACAERPPVQRRLAAVASAG